MHAPPGGTTPFQMSSQTSSSATSLATSVPAQSDLRSSSRHRPAVAASHIAPSAAASFPCAVMSAAFSVSHTASAVPPEDSQQDFVRLHHAVANFAGKSAADTGVPPDEPPPPHPDIESQKVTATTTDGLRIASLYARQRRGRELRVGSRRALLAAHHRGRVREPFDGSRLKRLRTATNVTSTNARARFGARAPLTSQPQPASPPALPVDPAVPVALAPPVPA